MQSELVEAHSGGLKLCGDIHLPESGPAPCIICSHGLFSSKESPKFIAMAQTLAASGFVAVRYDHRGCGRSEGAIEETTVSGRIRDLKAIYRTIRPHPALNGRFGLMGSSMGGYVSLLTAGQLEVSALAIWSTPFAIGPTKKTDANAPHPVLNHGFHADLNRHQLHRVLGGVGSCLVVQGQNDELVPLWHALAIYSGLKCPKTLEILPGADHRMSVDAHRQWAMDRSVRFFQTRLM
jgi:alpha-beta hydrolase superfamily lysophospholipase